MTEQEFAAIRKQWRETRTLDTDQRIDSLIRAVEERDAIIHDLMVDSSTLSRRAVEEFAAGLWDWMDSERKHQGTLKGDYHHGSACAFAVVQGEVRDRFLNPAPDPLPPDQVRAENERLREKLRAIHNQVKEWQRQVVDYGDEWTELESALVELAKSVLDWMLKIASEEVTR